MEAIRARRGSDAKVGAETVSVTKADWASMVDVVVWIFMWLSSRGGYFPPKIESHPPSISSLSTEDMVT